MTYDFRYSKLAPNSILGFLFILIFVLVDFLIVYVEVVLAAFNVKLPRIKLNISNFLFVFIVLTSLCKLNFLKK